MTTSRRTGRTAPPRAASRTAPIAKAAPAVPAAEPIRPADAALGRVTAGLKTAEGAAPARAAERAKPIKEEKPKKPKLVRDSFTIPKAEYAVIVALKERAARLGHPAKKSEVLRAGVKALEAMADPAFMSCLGGVPSIKTGRPAKT